jgi:hypothetical protein
MQRVYANLFVRSADTSGNAVALAAATDIEAI